MPLCVLISLTCLWKWFEEVQLEFLPTIKVHENGSSKGHIDRDFLFDQVTNIDFNGYI